VDQSWKGYRILFVLQPASSWQLRLSGEALGGQDDGRWSHSFDRLSFGYGRHRGVNKVTAISKASKECSARPMNAPDTNGAERVEKSKKLRIYLISLSA
jgi:hypothetical protein